MKDYFAHSRKFIIRGILAIIPLYFAYLTVKFLYVFIDKQVNEFVYNLVGYSIPGLGIFIFLIILYCIGMIASNVIGKRLFVVIDNICHRIPLINTVYQVGKQISDTLSLPEKQIFRKAVLVAIAPGTWAVGFVTGSILAQDNKERIIKILIPTTPNPATGFVILVRESEVIDTQWTIDEAIRTVISGGIIGPEQVSLMKQKQA